MTLYYEMNIFPTDIILDNFNSFYATHLMNGIEYLMRKKRKKERKKEKTLIHISQGEQMV
jgi:hypothetical protein